MVGARSAAMALNRLIDAEMDARNPRTAARELPAGRLGRREVWVFTAVSVALLVLAAFQLSLPVSLPLADPAGGLRLLPVREAVHVVLPLRPGAHPWSGTGGRVARGQRPPGRGGLDPVRRRRAAGWAVSTWCTRSSTSTSTASTGFTRCRSSLGAAGALRVAALSHVCAVVLLGLVGVIAGLPGVYWAGLAVVAALLAWPHVDIARRGLPQVGMSFMTVNGAVGLLYGAVVVVSTLWG